MATRRRGSAMAGAVIGAHAHPIRPPAGRPRSSAARWALVTAAALAGALAACGKATPPAAPTTSATAKSTTTSTTTTTSTNWTTTTTTTPTATTLSTVVTVKGGPDGSYTARLLEELGPPPAPVEGALGALKKQLTAALTTAMARGGPVAALDACQLQAPAIAAGLQLPGLRIGRTSHRLRNPANAAPAWAAPAVTTGPTLRLDKLRTRQHFSIVPEPVAAGQATGKTRRGYLEAIITGEVCVSCHGPSEGLDDGVRAKLALLYPNDAARGFEKGQLRGWFWAEYDADVAGGVAPAATTP